MNDIEITCISKDTIGAMATVTATIFEPLGSIKRVKDVVVVDIEGGHLMDHEQLGEQVLEMYNNEL